MSRKYTDREVDEIVAENQMLKNRAEVIDEFLIITKTNPDGIITYANDAFLKISKYSREELIGKPHNIVRHPDVPKALFEMLWLKLKVKKEGWRGVVKNMAKDGNAYYVESYISPVFNASGELVEYISVRKDMTKRIERELSLNSEKKFVQDVLDSQDSIILLTNENQGMLDVNKKFFEYVNFTSIKEFKKYFQCIGDLFIPEEELMYNCSIDWIEDIFHNKNKVHKAKFIGRDNRVHYFAIRVEKITASKSRIKKYNLNSESLYLITLLDITTLELALQKANTGIESKSRFLANMSHEIRTPMNGILGFTELMKKTNLTADQEKYINTISSSSKTLLGIINDILDFSKVESGKMSLEFLKFNPISELEPTLELFKAKMIEKRIHYLLFVDPKLPKWITLDALRLKQVISNLIGNALKFTPENGTVKVDITCSRSNLKYINLHISIQDTGIGIPLAQQTKIFTPFSQADESTTRKFGGTGLGLSISKSFITLMGGELKLESEVGKGSKFYFDIEVESSDEVAIDSNWLKGKKSTIYISNRNMVNGEVILLEKYLTAFHLDVEITDDLSKLRNNKLVWIITSAFEQNDIENLKTISNIQLVVIEGYEHSLIQEFRHSQINKISAQLGMSEIYNVLVGKLGNNLSIKQKIISKNTQKTIFQNANILVAEDNEVNQMFIEIILKEYEIQVDIVENGKLAVEQFKSNKYDLILMDINMPILGGIEATKEIRQTDSEIPIIALTANAMVGDREKFLAEGMTDYLTKPIDIKELERVLKQYLCSEIQEVEKSSKITNNNIRGGNTDMIQIPENSFEPISKDIISQELGLPEIFINKLVGKFVETIDSNFANLELAIKSEDGEAIKNTAHKIKGSAGNLRFKYLAEMMRVIEYAGKENNVTGFADIIAEVKSEIQVVKDFAN